MSKPDAKCGKGGGFSGAGIESCQNFPLKLKSYFFMRKEPRSRRCLASGREPIKWTWKNCFKSNNEEGDGRIKVGISW
jgi:hypothetical protein